MPAFLSRLEWIKNKGRGDTQLIDNWKTINVKISSELKNNRITINLYNDFGKASPRVYNNSQGSAVGEGAFQIDDKFKFYAKYDSDNTGLDFLSENSNDLVFFGDLRELRSKVSDKSILKLICTDRTFNILNRIAWVNYQIGDSKSPNGEGWTSPLMVQDVVRQRSGTNKRATAKNQFIYDREGNLTPSDAESTEYLEIDARLASEGGFIQDNRSITITKDGTEVSRTIGTPDSNNNLFPTTPIATQNFNFPFQKYTKAGKPVYEILLNLSQIDMTNTADELDPDASGDLIIKRAMRFYMDEKNRLHWFYPISTVDEDKFGNSINLVMGEDTIYEIKNHNLKFVIFEVINFIYFEAGVDMNGDSILGFRYDPTSGTPTLKQSKRSYPRISESMKQEDDITRREGGHITPDASLKGGYAFPADYGSGIQPLWNTEVTVNNDAEYNVEFKKQARKEANAKADSIIKGASSQRWKGSIETRFYNFTITDLLQFTSEAGGISQELLRINSISHNFQKSGSFTSLTVEADGKELEA